jgi:NADP-dependent 3-hydroxy acid dehydrogenase YdfG
MIDTYPWVLVTGASRGIGRAVAVALAADGYCPILWARSGAELAQLAAEVRALGRDTRTACVDIGDPAAVALAAQESLSTLTGLAGVVLNAGRGVWAGLAATDPDEWDRTIRTNLSGGFHVLRVCLPLLTVTPGALIVGLLSDSAVYPFPERAAYAASKSGLQALLEVARRELREQGVRVSVIVPSRVDTYFHGAHADATPGTRKGALAATDIAALVAGIFRLPPEVELRETHVSAMTSTFGPFPERAPA